MKIKQFLINNKLKKKMVGKCPHQNIIRGGGISGGKLSGYRIKYIFIVF